jgi:hypothetical protein
MAAKPLSREERIASKNRAAFAEYRAKSGKHLDYAKSYLADVERALSSGDIGQVASLGALSLNAFINATSPGTNDGVPNFVFTMRQLSSASREAVEAEDAAVAAKAKAEEEARQAAIAAKAARRAEWEHRRALDREFGE